MTGLASLAASQHRFREARDLAEQRAASKPGQRRSLRDPRGRARRAGPLPRRPLRPSTAWSCSSLPSPRMRGSPTRGSSSDAVRRRDRRDDAWRSKPAPRAPSTRPGRSCSSETSSSTRDGRAPPRRPIARRSPASRATSTRRRRLPESRPRAGRYERAVRLYRRAVDRCRCRSTRSRSATSLSVAGRQAEARAPTRSSMRSTASSARTACGPSSRPRSSTSTTAVALHDALARAREALRAAPSIEAEDVLAWALARMAAAPRRARTRSERSASVRRTLSSSSTAA